MRLHGQHFVYVDTCRSHVSGVFPTTKYRKRSTILNDPRVQDDRTRTCYIQTGLWKCCAVWSKRALIQKLQMVQHSAPRLITRQRRRDYQHITSSLIALIWLPVRWRINYKILLLTHRALRDLAPAYIVDIISPYTQGRRLRSADSNLLTVPRHDMERYGRRGFSVTASRFWNDLPIYIYIYIYIYISASLTHS